MNRIRPRHRAFSLLELVVALGSMSIVMVAIGSIVVLALRAVPADDRPSEAFQSSSEAFDTLTRELAFCTALTRIDSNLVRFTGPDVTSDGVSDQVTYEWSGTTGDPLLRTVNAGTAHVVATGITSFALAYDVIEDSETRGGMPEVSSPARILDSTPATTTPTSVSVSTLRAAEVRPALPADAIAWGVTAVTLKLTPASGMRASDTLTISVSLMDPATGKPSGFPITTHTINGNDINAANISNATSLWYTADIDDVMGVPTTRSLMIICSGGLMRTAARIEAGPTPANAGALNHLFASSDVGMSWTEVTGSALAIRVDGVIERSPAVVTTIRRVRAVDVTLATQDAYAASLNSRVHLLTRPEEP